MRDWCSAAVRWAREDEEGASLVEYLLVVFLIAMVCVSATAFFGRRVRFGLNNVGRVIRRGF